MYGTKNRQYFGDFMGSPADVGVSLSYNVGGTSFVLVGKLPPTGSPAIIPGENDAERERERQR